MQTKVRSSATKAALLHAAVLVTGFAAAHAQALPPLPPLVSSPNEFIDTPLSVAIDANGGELPETPITPLRPFKFAFYANPLFESDVVLLPYVLNKLLPSVQSLLARSLRVRNPSGVLDLGGKQATTFQPGFTTPGEFNSVNTTIPPPPANSDGTPAVGYDADLVFEIAVAPGGCGGVSGSHAPVLLERGTSRPVFASLELCTLDGTLSTFDIRVAAAILTKAAVLNPALFLRYPRPPGAPFQLALSPAGKPISQTEQVVDHVRTFFDCETLLGAETEGLLQGGNWELRLYLGEVVVFFASFTDSHYSRQVITDLSLSQIQDSTWFDVIYGSQGFVSYGYQAGCEFVNVTAPFEEALAVPEAARYLCPAVANDTLRCHHDHSGAGVCSTTALLDPFITTLDFPNVAGEPRRTLDCQSSGLRCLQRSSGAASPECVDMSCSPSGDVLIAGSPCDPEKFDCPDRNVMCGDPGFLTCRDSLNDCSGAGDCFRGRCFCHLGFGGADCSKRLCIDHCADGSPCPPSGVCGEPVCGKFSTGADDRGTPCNAPLTSKIPSIAPPSPPSKPSPEPKPSPKPTPKPKSPSGVSITVNGVKVPSPPQGMGKTPPPPATPKPPQSPSKPSPPPPLSKPPTPPAQTPKVKAPPPGKDKFTFVVTSTSTSGATATVDVKRH